MPVITSAKSELLESIEPFSIRTGRLPGSHDMKRIGRLVIELENEGHSRIDLARVGGLWECVFTTSRFVLGLDKFPMLRLSAVHQDVTIANDGAAGSYFNIAELIRADRVRVLCGEYAIISRSPSHLQMIDVRYQWFYFAIRALKPYEGHQTAAACLRSGDLRNCLRVPFHKAGWQRNTYVDDELRIVRGNEGGLFLLKRCDARPTQCNFAAGDASAPALAHP
jgi:hypothetical protein